MSHSHMPVEHILRQIEHDTRNRQSRDVRPKWLTEFVDDLGQMFIPLSAVARVGFDCQFAEDRWVVGMYLGATEIVGGRLDGQIIFSNFELDLRRLIGRFVHIREFCWNALPQLQSFDEDDGSERVRERSYVTIDGDINEHPIRVNFFSVPPDGIPPALRLLGDGTYEPV